MTTPTPAIPLTKAAAAARYYRDHGDLQRAEDLEAGLRAAGRCRDCGRTLTDPVSVAAGVGPDCRAKARAR